MTEQSLEDAMAEIARHRQDRDIPLAVKPTKLLLNDYWAATPERRALAQRVAREAYEG